ncbi:unnamed protein product [Rhizoctonia solani]|uniref:Thioredoxin n=1 Tax=Rhizoctonia solani TaxID=456999 RepID=A0A8H3GQJ9_9AGAM|nr:unnamed protein product [Rhizoctonia solani]
MADKIIHIASLDQHNQLTKEGLVIIDFHASWCGPCHMIAPTYETLAGENENIKFFKVDVDNVPDVAQHYKITAMPTFVILKDGEKIDEMKGANQGGLTGLVQKLNNA